MTQKEKAKRYDAAVMEASIAYKDEDKHLKATLERIFPELKESEDERIRKALIDYFDDANKADENPLQNYGIHTNKVIAWLERQSKQNPAMWNKEDEDYCLDVNAAVDCYFGDIYAEELRDWLKSLKERVQSLKPHHHLIPTKRQMECFEDFLLHIPSTNPNKMCLAGIYEELKNLT